MDKQKSYVVGALGVLAGVVIGASGVHNAQMVSFSGANPNAAADQRNFREENDGQYRNNRINNYKRAAMRVRVDLRDIARARRDNRQRSAAPDHDNKFSACKGLSSMRLTRCIWAELNGEPYHPNEWGL